MSRDSRPPPPGHELDGLQELLKLLDGSPDRALEEYFRIRRRLVHMFEWRGARSPEDLADETLSRVADKLRLGQRIDIYASDPLSYFRGVGHHVFLESVREQSRLAPLRDGGRTQPDDPFEAPEDDRPLSALQQCLGELKPPDRALVLEYYQGNNRIEARKKLATRLGRTTNALRVRAHRIRQRLEDCVRKHLACEE